MKKISLFMWGMAMMAALTFTACSSSSDDDNGGGGGTSGGNDGPAPTEFSYAPLTGVVENYGNPINGVSVMSGNQVLATTDANGVFTLDKVPTNNNRTILKFKKPGYVDIVRSFEKKDNAIWHVQMIQDGNTRSTSFNAANGGDVKITRTIWVDNQSKEIEMKVELPKAYKDAKGNAYTGEVNAKLAYISPDDNNFSDVMPGGDLAAERTDGSDAQLISYGMTGVELTDANGNALNLADGQEATVSFPIPASMQASAATLDEIPLWSFDEEKGVWVEEGIAKKQGDAYVGKVKHFSWWNLDYPESRATLKVTAVDTSGKKLENVKLNVDGQRTWWTGSDGVAQGYIPSNTRISVIATTEYGFRGEKTVEPTPAGTTVTLPFELQKVSVISGTVTVASGSKTCKVSLSCASGEIEVISDMLGRYRLYVPSTYKGLATITASNSKGETTSKDVVLDENDKVVNLSFQTESAAEKSPGKLVLTPDDGQGSVTYTFPPATSGRSASVSLVDASLRVNYSVNDGDNEHSLSFSISNYDPSVSTYDAPVFYFRETNYDAQTGIYARTQVNCYIKNNSWYDASEGTLTITRSGDNMTFKFDGVKVYYQTANDKFGEWYKDSQRGDAKASIEITAPIVFEAKGYYNQTDISALKSQLPSFMPVLSGKKFNAMIVEKSEEFGKGAVVCYLDADISDSEYQGLHSSAQSQFGDPVKLAGMEEMEMDEGMKEHQDMWGKTYYKDGKIMNISRSMHYQPQEGQRNEFQFDESYVWGESWNSAVTVRAFESVNVPITSLIRY